ncbi:MAG: hypothetical protein JW788_04255 [Candidatus Omnitrophica bacterium]|nr:hypothetical protein [Candidatus Omnitrophota bacterium]
MPERLERLIRMIYKRRKRALKPGPGSKHPSEEELACFLERRLSQEESRRIKLHIISCQRCAESLGISIKSNALKDNERLPGELIDWAKDLVGPATEEVALEIFLSLKAKVIEILHTTGQVIAGRKLGPVFAWRGHKGKDFKNEVTILKDFKGIRIKVKIENKDKGFFGVVVSVKDKKTGRVLKDLRISLFKEEKELESYLAQKGVVTFEHVLLGKYSVEISDIEKKVASILLEVKN